MDDDHLELTLSVEQMPRASCVLSNNSHVIYSDLQIIQGVDYYTLSPLLISKAKDLCVKRWMPYSWVFWVLSLKIVNDVKEGI